MRSMKLAMGAMLLAVMAPAAAEAQYWGGPPPHARAYGYDRGGPPPRGYGRPDGGRRYDDRTYRGRRYRCDRGTGGTIIGAIAGGLLGNSFAGRGDRAAGTVVGAGVGALAGRAIDRDC